MDLVTIARILALFGISLLVVAGIFFLISHLNIPLGNLPGDLVIKRGNFSCIFPLATSLIISVVLTIMINLIISFLNKQ
jgi:hypothetical protein